MGKQKKKNLFLSWHRNMSKVIYSLSMHFNNCPNNVTVWYCKIRRRWRCTTKHCFESIQICRYAQINKMSPNYIAQNLHASTTILHLHQNRGYFQHGDWYYIASTMLFNQVKITSINKFSLPRACCYTEAAKFKFLI